MRKVREGFIDDEDEEDAKSYHERRREKRKRRRAERNEEEAVLDEEDLDLIGEANPEFERKPPSEVSTLLQAGCICLQFAVSRSSSDLKEDIKEIASNTELGVSMTSSRKTMTMKWGMMPTIVSRVIAIRSE